MPSSILSKRRHWIGFVLLVTIGAAATAMAQFGGRQRTYDRNEFPTWEIDPNFKQDTFTFARIQYGSGGRGGWSNDYPDCDINFSLRLQQLTSMNVNPDNVVLELTDPELFDYPFIFMSNVQGMWLRPAEQEALRKYLLNGGFLMADDFWTPSRVAARQRGHETSLARS